jgi:Domain of unknown function (DUF4456)
VLGYLNKKYTAIIAKELSKEDVKFKKLKKQDADTKDNHLRLFRPNLENPANK